MAWEIFMPLPRSFALLSVMMLSAVPAAAATRGFTITGFDAIRVDAPVEVVITTGAGASARAEGDQAMLDRLKVDVSGRLLPVTLERARSGEQSGGRAVLRLASVVQIGRESRRGGVG